jgi:hypothetical protein
VKTAVPAMIATFMNKVFVQIALMNNLCYSKCKQEGG